MPIADVTLDRLGEDALAVLFTEARTASNFSDEPVSDEQLAAIWESTRWAPTSANTQPMRVLWIRTDEGKARLLPHLAEANQPKSASAPAVAVLAIDTAYHEHIPTLLPFRPEMRDTLAADDVMREKMGSLSAHLQAGYFILAVRAHGLAAGPMGGFDAAGVDAELFPDGRWKSFLVVNVGHPGDQPWLERLPRLDHSEAVAWA